MMWKLFRRKVWNYLGLSHGHFVEAKSYYAMRHDSVPCVSFVGEIDGSAAFAFIERRYRDEIVDVLQHSYFNHEEQRVIFNNTIFVLDAKRMIEVCPHYCQVLHASKHYRWAHLLLAQLAEYRIEVPENKVIGFAKPQEVH